MNTKRYSVNDINKILNKTTKEITEEYYDKMDMRDVGVMNTYIWHLLENFKATINTRDMNGDVE